jgi:hypothetical protein
MKKKILSGLVLFFIFHTGCFEQDETNDEEINNADLIEHFHYEVEIINENKSFFSAIVPIPIQSLIYNPNRGEPSKLLENLSLLYGNAEYYIYNSEYGYSLRIESNSSLKLVAHKNIVNYEVQLDEIIFEISMEKNSPGISPYFFKLNSTDNYNIKMNFDSYWYSEPQRSESLIYHADNIKMQNGWNEIFLY